MVLKVRTIVLQCGGIGFCEDVLEYSIWCASFLLVFVSTEVVLEISSFFNPYTVCNRHRLPSDCLVVKWLSLCRAVANTPFTPP